MTASAKCSHHTPHYVLNGAFYTIRFSSSFYFVAKLKTFFIFLCALFMANFLMRAKYEVNSSGLACGSKERKVSTSRRQWRHTHTHEKKTAATFHVAIYLIVSTTRALTHLIQFLRNRHSRTHAATTHSNVIGKFKEFSTLEYHHVRITHFFCWRFFMSTMWIQCTRTCSKREVRS